MKMFNHPQKFDFFKEETPPLFKYLIIRVAVTVVLTLSSIAVSTMFLENPTAKGCHIKR